KSPQSKKPLHFVFSAPSVCLAGMSRAEALEANLTALRDVRKVPPAGTGVRDDAVLLVRTIVVPRTRALLTPANGSRRLGGLDNFDAILGAAIGARAQECELQNGLRCPSNDRNRSPLI